MLSPFRETASDGHPPALDGARCRSTKARRALPPPPPASCGSVNPSGAPDLPACRLRQFFPPRPPTLGETLGSPRRRVSRKVTWRLANASEPEKAMCDVAGEPALETAHPEWPA